MKEQIAGSLFGLVVGDALGVPVEFSSRSQLDADPVTGMRGFGTHHQPPGTWSDDSSLMLCLVESLIESGIDFDDQARRFVLWRDRDEWTPHGEVFDIGMATDSAICRLAGGVTPVEAGGTSESSCGNGSLMRIVPLAFYLAGVDQAQRTDITRSASRLTHGHIRCQLACVLFVELMVRLFHGESLDAALRQVRSKLTEMLMSIAPAEMPNFERLLQADFRGIPRSAIRGSGYVIDCLEASLWCALRSSSYAEAVLSAVNLGDDTDTTGAVSGAIAGLQYGLAGIPTEWLTTLARYEELLDLVNQFTTACESRELK